MPYLQPQEKRTLANELLKTPEACLPWEPFPAARILSECGVDVIHVTEDYGENRRPGEYFTIALAAATEPTETEPGPAAAWSLDFTRCEAYRRRIIYYEGSAPLTQPARRPAFWEITGSHYLIESGVWGAYYPTEFHHYVIVSACTTVHEVLATGWRCTPLPPEWAKRFDGPLPPWPPVEP